jgi:excisionase family DNA binding protein
MRALQLELEQVKYEARLAARRYESVDPENRLVSSELEARWNAALCRVQELESRVSQVQEQSAPVPTDKEELLRLAKDLPEVWESPSIDATLKQRIIRILVQEVVADIDEQCQEITLVIHWVGGRHSALRVPRAKSGQHGRCTKTEAIDIVRQMAPSYSDEDIALTLNRLGLRTGAGNTWNETRIRSVRSHFKLPACQPAQREGRINLQEAARQLGVSPTFVRQLIEQKLLPATQIVAGAPWEISTQDVISAEVIQAAAALKNRDNRRRRIYPDERTLPLPGVAEEAGIAAS